ncbi:MAG: hypothetical protein LLG02_03390 [Pelosinus sp.]|nr:hypothetical protein [Pelosinus sp.]
MKAIKLLKHGIKVRGNFIKKEERPYQDSGGICDLAKYYFKYNDNNGQEHIILEWSGSPNYFDETHNATILFNPLKPEEAKALDLINGAPLIVFDNEVKSDNSVKPLIFAFFMVLLCIVAFIILLLQ